MFDPGALTAIRDFASHRLAERIIGLDLPAAPHVLDIGSGEAPATAVLCPRMRGGLWVLGDRAPTWRPPRETALMGASSSGAAVAPCFVGLDEAAPPFAVEPGFDLISVGVPARLAAGTMAHLPGRLARLAGLLRPGGHLAFATLLSGSFAERRAAGVAEAIPGGIADLPDGRALAAMLPMVGTGQVDECVLTLLGHSPAGRAALARAAADPLAQPGPEPDLPRPSDSMPRTIGMGLRRFAAGGDALTIHLGIALFRRALVRQGVFVTGTDTGVGKTLAAAVLARAWGASYWKPLQTGLAAEPGDTETVAGLAALPGERVHAPAWALAAPLSPAAAAAAEGKRIPLDAITPPASRAPLVIEGAGGVLVPINETALMTDLMLRLGVPVVLVGRGTLGTINHTLLSIEALRRRGLRLLGVVLNGPVAPGNRAAIESRGATRVIAELPQLDRIDAAAVARLAAALPPLHTLMAALAEAGAKLPR